MKNASEILRQLPRGCFKGNFEKSEIELDTSLGHAELLYEDNYVAVVRDTVRFPPRGNKGKYLRIVEKSALGDGVAGVVIVPIMDDKFILLSTFRHPTRTWEIEFPRGFCNAGSTPIENAKREAKEELGMYPDDLKFIGEIKPNTGLLASRVHVFLAKFSQLPDLVSEKGREEAIDIYLPMDETQLEELISNGEISDSFTLSSYALLKLAELKNDLA